MISWLVVNKQVIWYHQSILDRNRGVFRNDKKMPLDGPSDYCQELKGLHGMTYRIFTCIGAENSLKKMLAPSRLLLSLLLLYLYDIFVEERTPGGGGVFQAELTRLIYAVSVYLRGQPLRLPWIETQCQITFPDYIGNMVGPFKGISTFNV